MAPHGRDSNGTSRGSAFPADRRAMAPVIAIVLMVAIAVVLGSIVGVFSFSLFDHRTNPSPQVTFTYDYDDSAGELTITHDGGDKFDRANVRIIREGEVSPTDPWPTTVQAGDSTTVGVADDDELRIVWEDPRERGITALLGTWNGPRA